MRLMTPTEYADAYAYWKEQTGRRARAEVVDLIDERTVRMLADVHRLAARDRWRDAPEDCVRRQLVLMTENPTRRAA